YTREHQKEKDVFSSLLSNRMHKWTGLSLTTCRTQEFHWIENLLNRDHDKPKCLHESLFRF
ncbi:hypothetical protein Bpfe_017884, partial [Biomphalaria pfeifferi]